ncbi:DUF3883 domain-containing protein [Acinetobacter beijerinckii]|uniref:Protein NO VEIN C-terminal domain-containing protein n=1 Tax=Acinetobacter beijerinckii CIP 110307 TaxID=1217648 RepID=N9E5P4_9GAMM|nr:DUF3883 domain-containing protein [Acinetobacter beijerinckii]ENW05467.1 hypothetical protein F933_02367 [Acinetobacter beijerinckii CIP 110307]MDF2417686.1 DUF3883 domain-containing protein [Acinetobacter beijerinckii]
MAILFCNVGWMEKYQGNRASDQIQGGGSFVEIEGSGGEVCNFSPDKDMLYGFVQTRGQINIDNLGASKTDEFINGVTVVWTATNPKTKGTYIIGWYKNATVFRYYQKFEVIPKVQRENGIDCYRIRALKVDARLLSTDERIYSIPRAGQSGFGMGQELIWYGKGEKNAALIKEIYQFIESKERVIDVKNRLNRSYDQAKKVQVEKAAIETSCQYFESLGYDVKSVEKDNLGWDIEAIAGKLKLRIEVKGLSGTNFTIGLTPNEYSAFLQEDLDYRLAVVTNALVEPKLWICRFSIEQNDWIAEAVDRDEYQTLNIDQKVSAIIELKTKISKEKTQ